MAGRTDCGNAMITNRAWISKNPSLEMISFYAVGLIALFIFFFLPDSKISVALFIFAGVLDAGHGYITAFRSFSHSDRSFQKKAMALLIFIFLLSVLLFYLHVPYLWTFLVYFTFYHHQKQNIGITKIYGRLHKLTKTWEEAFAEFLILVSFFAMHTRPNLELNIYGKDDFIFFPIEGLSAHIIHFILLLTFLFLARVLYLLVRNKSRLSYYLSLAVPTTMNVVCFLFGENVFQIVGPLLIYHALIYIVITSDVVKTKNMLKYSPAIILVVVVSTAIVSGLLEFILSEQVESFSYLNHDGLSLLLLAIINTPAIWHYLIDGLIWKRTDPDFLTYTQTF